MEKTTDKVKWKDNCQDYTVFNATDDSNKTLNSNVTDKDTKSSGEAWMLNLQMTFSYNHT